ncbi:acyltransferase family protein [Xanthobacter autotrophicus]|uniref:acyltransferase family protein n=1 Tax=Xanthobacter autotrophicus TaxID=280 RepID=UPI003729C996
MMEIAKEKQKFQIIEFARGIAAILVVMHHSGSIMSQPRFFATEPFGQHLRYFNVGVDFFFVLSGFLITWVHLKDIGRPDRLGNFARKRFLRIYPPYWGIVVPLIALYLIFPGAGVPSQRDPLNIVASIFLLPYTEPPVLGVAWTLTHEVLFYVLFAFAIVRGRMWLSILPLWAAAIIIANIALPSLSFPFSFLLNPFNLEFIMGTAIAWFASRADVPRPWAWLWIGALAFVGLMLFATNLQDIPLIGRLGFGLTASIFVLGAIGVEKGREINLPKFLGLLGAASYAIYLAHPVALSLGVHLLSRIPGSHAVSPAIIAMALVAIGVGAGLAYHLVLERRLLQLARYVLDNPPRFLPRRQTVASTNEPPVLNNALATAANEDVESKS